MVTFEYRFDVLPGKLDEYEKYVEGPGKDIWLKFPGVKAVRVYKSMLGGSSPQRLVQVDLESLAALEKSSRIRASERSSTSSMASSRTSPTPCSSRSATRRSRDHPTAA